MGRACKYCGGRVQWKDKRGWYRDFCRSCAEAVADGHDLEARYDTDDDPLADPDRSYEE